MKSFCYKSYGYSTIVKSKNFSSDSGHNFELADQSEKKYFRTLLVTQGETINKRTLQLDYYKESSKQKMPIHMFNAFIPSRIASCLIKVRDLLTVDQYLDLFFYL